MLIGECTYYVLVISKNRKTWNIVIRLVIALQYNITSWSLQNQAVSDRIKLHTYIQPCLAVTMFSRNKTHPPNIVGNPRSVALILPTFSDNVLWVLTSNPQLFLKDLSLKNWIKWFENFGDGGDHSKTLCFYIWLSLIMG